MSDKDLLKVPKENASADEHTLASVARVKSLLNGLNKKMADNEMPVGEAVASALTLLRIQGDRGNIDDALEEAVRQVLLKSLNNAVPALDAP